MSQNPPVAGGQTFADFMYAVVVGVAFSDIKLSDSKSVLFVTVLILLMVLEDFFMYQTQVKPLVDVFKFWTLGSLFFEVGMLLSWFLAFLSRREFLRGSLVCIAIFFFLKWLASAKHLASTPQARRWVLHRDHLYLMSVAAALLLVFFDRNYLGAYLILTAVWVVQTGLWWVVVSRHS